VPQEARRHIPRPGRQGVRKRGPPFEAQPDRSDEDPGVQRQHGATERERDHDGGQGCQERPSRRQHALDDRQSGGEASGDADAPLPLAKLHVQRERRFACGYLDDRRIEVGVEYVERSAEGALKQGRRVEAEGAPPAEQVVEERTPGTGLLGQPAADDLAHQVVVVRLRRQQHERGRQADRPSDPARAGHGPIRFTCTSGPFGLRSWVRSISPATCQSASPSASISTCTTSKRRGPSGRNCVCSVSRAS